jgi:hypothetical protein
MNTFMKTAKKPKAKATAVKPKARHYNVNIEYVNEIADESIATIMALRSLIGQLVAQAEDRK